MTRPRILCLESQRSRAAWKSLPAVLAGGLFLLVPGAKVGFAECSRCVARSCVEHLELSGPAFCREWEPPPGGGDRFCSNGRIRCIQILRNGPPGEG